jgi:hypothetical protein
MLYFIIFLPGCSWFRIGTGVDSCEHGNESTGSIRAGNFLTI